MRWPRSTGSPARHIIVSDGPRIAGVARLAAGSYTPDRYAGQTLSAIMADDFVIAPQTTILNTDHQPHEPARAALRHRRQPAVRGIPRPEDVVGVIAAPEIAGAVIANHYA